jgi:hypothetical protein
LEQLRAAVNRQISSLRPLQAAEAVGTTCLDKDDLTPSMELAGELIAAAIEGLVFLSVVAGDDNLIVRRANCGRYVSEPFQPSLLTTTAFDCGGGRWFEASSCEAAWEASLSSVM